MHAFIQQSAFLPSLSRSRLCRSRPLRLIQKPVTHRPPSASLRRTSAPLWRVATEACINVALCVIAVTASVAARARALAATSAVMGIVVVAMVVWRRGRESGSDTGGMEKVITQVDQVGNLIGKLGDQMEEMEIDRKRRGEQMIEKIRVLEEELGRERRRADRYKREVEYGESTMVELREKIGALKARVEKTAEIQENVGRLKTENAELRERASVLGEERNKDRERVDTLEGIVARLRGMIGGVRERERFLGQVRGIPGLDKDKVSADQQSESMVGSEWPESVLDRSADDAAKVAQLDGLPPDGGFGDDIAPKENDSEIFEGVGPSKKETMRLPGTGVDKVFSFSRGEFEHNSREELTKNGNRSSNWGGVASRNAIDDQSNMSSPEELNVSKDNETTVLNEPYRSAESSSEDLEGEMGADRLGDENDLGLERGGLTETMLDGESQRGELGETIVGGHNTDEVWKKDIDKSKITEERERDPIQRVQASLNDVEPEPIGEPNIVSESNGNLRSFGEGDLQQDENQPVSETIMGRDNPALVDSGRQASSIDLPSDNIINSEDGFAVSKLENIAFASEIPPATSTMHSQASTDNLAEEDTGFVQDTSCTNELNIEDKSTTPGVNPSGPFTSPASRIQSRDEAAGKWTQSLEGVTQSINHAPPNPTFSSNRPAHGLSTTYLSSLSPDHTSSTIDSVSAAPISNISSSDGGVQTAASPQLSQSNLSIETSRNVEQENSSSMHSSQEPFPSQQPFSRTGDGNVTTAPSVMFTSQQPKTISKDNESDLEDSRSYAESSPPPEPTAAEHLQAASKLIKKARVRGLAVAQSDQLFRKALMRVEEAATAGATEMQVRVQRGVILLSWAKANVLDVGAQDKLLEAKRCLKDTQGFEDKELVQTSLGLCLCLLGSMTSGNESKQYYIKAVEIYESLFANDEAGDDRIGSFNCGLACLSLGRIAKREENADEHHKANAWFEKAQEWFEKAVRLRSDDAKAIAYVEECRRELQG